MAQLPVDSPLSQFPALQAFKKENDYCIDCDAPNPTWCVINKGVLICLDCSGCHRNLGVHISKVRSIEIDKWNQIWVDNLQSHSKFNEIQEFHVPSNFMKPTQYSQRELREKYITAKYCGRNSKVKNGEGLFSKQFCDKGTLRQPPKSDVSAKDAKRNSYFCFFYFFLFLFFYFFIFLFSSHRFDEFKEFHS